MFCGYFSTKRDGLKIHNKDPVCTPHSTHHTPDAPHRPHTIDDDLKPPCRYAPHLRPHTAHPPLKRLRSEPLGLSEWVTTNSGVRLSGIRTSHSDMTQQARTDIRTEATFGV